MGDGADGSDAVMVRRDGKKFSDSLVGHIMVIFTIEKVECVRVASPHSKALRHRKGRRGVKFRPSLCSWIVRVNEVLLRG